MASPEHCKRVARLLEHFFSQLVRDSTRGIKVARLTRDDQLGPQELKKFRLITKQNKGARKAGLSSRGLRALSPLSCSQSPPFFHCPLCPVEAPMIPALGIPVLTQTLLSRENTCNSTWRYLRIDAFSSDSAQRQSQLL